MTQIVKSLRSGQITIPAQFRERLGIEAESLLQVSMVEGELRIKPVRISDTASGSDWLKSLYDHFSKVRKTAKSRSEREINLTIDKAVKAVRSAHA